ncbi:hypothetical protein D9M69_455510 [compost metagenome]
MAIGEVAHRQAHQRIDGPAVHAPVEEGQLQRLARGGLSARLAFRWVVEVIDRLGRREVEQRNTDARGEQHPGPGAVAEVGAAVVGAQAQMAVAGEGDIEHEEQVGAYGQHVVPAETAREPALGLAEPGAGTIGEDDQGNREQQDERGGPEEHDRIQTHLAMACCY